MPLVYQQNINEVTKLAVWHIMEPESFFLEKVTLPRAINHPHKRLQHLAGRFLLPELFEDFPLDLIEIADTKKPFLPDEAFHFSISHCGDYVAAIVSRKNRVGVDIEVSADKIEKIKHKFLSGTEQEMINKIPAPVNVQYSMFNLQLLTLAWSIKETMFKWYAAGGIDFKEHLQVNSITINENESIAQCLFKKGDEVSLKVHGLYFNGNHLTWLVN